MSSHWKTLKLSSRLRIWFHRHQRSFILGITALVALGLFFWLAIPELIKLFNL